MREHIEQLSMYLDQCNVTTPERLPPNMSAEEAILTIHQMSGRLREIVESIQKLLREHIDPIFDAEICFTNEDEKELFDLAQKLCSYTIRLDVGLALRIYEALLTRARSLGDECAVLKYLYWCGITAYYMGRSMYPKSLEYFQQGAEYSHRYAEIPDEETRKYVHRCLGNVAMMLNLQDQHQQAFEREEVAFAFWNQLIFHGKDASFPWGNYFLSTLHHRRSRTTKALRTEPQKLTKVEARNYLRLAKTIHKLYHQNPKFGEAFGGSRYDFILWEAQFISGLISYDQLYQNVQERKRTLAADDFSQDALYVHIQMNSYLIFYARKMLPPDEKTQGIIDEISRDSAAYFTTIPMTADSETVSSLMKTHALNASNIYEPMQHLEMVLRMTSYRHMPTYAHSIMVSLIACLLTEVLVKTHPEDFVGICGITTAEQAEEKLAALLSFARMAGRCHDIGKIEFIYNPSILRRAPSEQEWAVIQSHTSAGQKLLDLDENAMDREMLGYADVIEGHHRHWDGVGGYPDTFDILNSPYRTMIGIIAVADAIDAATDNIGKVYAPGISLVEVCAQIVARSGTQYAPHVVELLEDENVFSAIDKALRDDRPAAYYQAYLNSWNRADGEGDWTNGEECAYA